MIKINEEHLARINEEKEKRDHFAFMLGTVQFEYERKKDQINAGVAMSEQRESEIAIHAMKEKGIDPDGGEFTIDKDTGEILMLIDGRWSGITDEQLMA